jgi:hypothetical protein
VVVELDIQHPEPAKSDADAASIVTVVQEPARPAMGNYCLHDRELNPGANGA